MSEKTVLTAKEAQWVHELKLVLNSQPRTLAIETDEDEKGVVIWKRKDYCTHTQMDVLKARVLGA